jgi:hypothetical protein
MVPPARFLIARQYLKGFSAADCLPAEQPDGPLRVDFLRGATNMRGCRQRTYFGHRENMPHLVKTIQLYWRDLSEGALCAGLSNRALDYLYAIAVRLYSGEDTRAGLLIRCGFTQNPFTRR